MKKSGSALSASAVLLLIFLTYIVGSCAKQGTPEGGPYDMTPPRFIKSTPINGSVQVKGNKIKLTFDENVKVEKSNEKVIFTPPQNTPPRIISGTGKSITIIFEDSLQSNTTYVIDFTDAIVDLNEGNPLEGFVFAFSTGDKIDSMEIRGRVFDAEGLYPIPDLMVGVHKEDVDSLFQKRPLLRTGKTLSDGSFVISHLAPGRYRLFALNDLDHSFSYSQRTEGFAFLPQMVDAVAPKPKQSDQDTLQKRDSIRPSGSSALITPHKNIERDSSMQKKENLTVEHLLLYSVDILKRTYLQKSARPDSTLFTLSFTQPLETLPQVRIIGAPSESQSLLLPQVKEKRMEVSYWITDSTYYKQDTLQIEARYDTLDSLEHPTLQTDTLKLIYRPSKKKRLDNQRSEGLNLTSSNGFGGQGNSTHLTGASNTPKEAVPSAPLHTQETGASVADSAQMTRELTPHLHPEFVKKESHFALSPRDTIAIRFEQPPLHIDTNKVHFYSVEDSTETPHPLHLRLHPENALQLQLLAPLQIGTQYRLRLDSAAIHSCYGMPNRATTLDFSIENEEKFGTLSLRIDSLQQHQGKAYFELRSEDNNIIMTREAIPDSLLLLDLLPAGTFYGHLWIDLNGNGKWDPAHYPTHQPEPSFFYSKPIGIQAKFTNEIRWNPTEEPLMKQRPSGLKIPEEAGNKNTQSGEKRQRQNLNEEYVKRMRERYGPKWNPSDHDRKILGLPSRAEEKVQRKAEEEALKAKRNKNRSRNS